MLTYKEFELLKILTKNSDVKKILENSKYKVFADVSEVNKALKELDENGYLKDLKPSKKAINELENHMVDNAIILSAGGNEMSAKSVYSMPKGLFVKDRETLIERQIRQLQEAGIKDISVVIGYKQELWLNGQKWV